MPVRMPLKIEIKSGGDTYKDERTVTAKQLIAKKIELPAAVAGSLTARTSASVGSVTAAGHGLADGDTVDLYWADGARRGAVVGTIAGNVIPLTDGSGDDLPATGTAVTITGVTQESVGFDGDHAVAPAFRRGQRCTVILASGSGPYAEELARVLPQSGAYVWVNDRDETNPVAGDSITTLFLSQASPLASQTVYVGVMAN